MRLDVDTWVIDRFWNGNTVPAIPVFFRENHVFYCHGDGAILAMIAQDAQILVLDDSANTLKILWSTKKEAGFSYRTGNNL